MGRIIMGTSEIGDAQILAPKLRACDVEEIWATVLKQPEEALKTVIEDSVLCWSGFVQGEICCIFGVGHGDGFGLPWMVASDLLTTNGSSFLRQVKAYVEEMQIAYPLLRNWVDARNETSIKWLEWLGFTIHEAEPYGALGLPFHMFDRRA